MLGESPLPADIVDRLNEAQRYICENLYYYYPSVPLTLVAGQSTYRLRDLSATTYKIVDPKMVTVANAPLGIPVHGKRMVYPVELFEQSYPNWRTASSGVPSAAGLAPPDWLILDVPPNSTVVNAGNHFISGTVYVPDLSASSLSGVSELPIVLHEAIARLAVVFSASTTVTEDYQKAKLDELKAQAVELIQIEGKGNMEALPFA